MKTTEKQALKKRLSDLTAVDFTADNNTYGKIEIVLGNLLEAHKTKNQELMRFAVKNARSSLPALIQKTDSKNEALEVLEDTLHRIARHMKERQGQYQKFYSVVASIIKSNPDLHNRHSDDLSSMKEALSSIENLASNPKNPEEVHSALRKISAAAHAAVFVQQSHTADVYKLLENEKSKVAHLEAKMERLIAENKTLRAKMKVAVPAPESVNRPVKVTTSTAPIVVKLINLKNSGLKYEPRDGDKRIYNPIEWARDHFCGDSDTLLSEAEFDIALRHPAVFKPFHTSLYNSIRVLR
jgi:hypothetical protein